MSSVAWFKSVMGGIRRGSFTLKTMTTTPSFTPSFYCASGWVPSDRAGAMKEASIADVLSKENLQPITEVLRLLTMPARG